MSSRINFSKKNITQGCISIILVILISVFIKKAYMNSQVKLSSLSQSQLWTVEQAKSMQEKAYQIDGMPMVLNEVALLALIKQAWQWDKNAMIQYVEIIQHEIGFPLDDDETFDHFLRVHREKIVDGNGRLLNEPPILKLPYWHFMEKLADLQYPLPASYVSVAMMGNNGTDKQGSYIPYDRQKTKRMLDYIRYSITGGYRRHEFLADTLLFRTGFGKKDENYQTINQLTDHAVDLSQEELLEAMRAYQVCADHGSDYCMMRLAEGYYHGIGFEKNLEQAYLWATLSNEAYTYYLEVVVPSAPRSDWLVDHIYKTHNDYNRSILSQIDQGITFEQREHTQVLKQEVGPKITWDYEIWARGCDPVPPTP